MITSLTYRLRTHWFSIRNHLAGSSLAFTTWHGPCEVLRYLSWHGPSHAGSKYCSWNFWQYLCSLGLSWVLVQKYNFLCAEITLNKTFSVSTNSKWRSQFRTTSLSQGYSPTALHMALCANLHIYILKAVGQHTLLQPNSIENRVTEVQH